ncbi:hypothetical protein BJV82DRAFT_676419 [Fennellomyces sp. T-0311]|nr:hypothetical protein BJV82DRAFT_676419 [Fennellomyces sp. T-0311]
MSYDASTNNDNILDEIAEVEKTFPKEEDDWLVNSNAAKKLKEFEEMMADLRRYLVIEALKENSDDEYVLASYHRGYYRGDSALQEVVKRKWNQSRNLLLALQLDNYVSKHSCYIPQRYESHEDMYFGRKDEANGQEDEDDDDTLPPSDLEDERPAKRQRSTD